MLFLPVTVVMKVTVVMEVMAIMIMVAGGTVSCGLNVEGTGQGDRGSVFAQSDASASLDSVTDSPVGDAILADDLSLADLATTEVVSDGKSDDAASSDGQPPDGDLDEIAKEASPDASSVACLEPSGKVFGGHCYFSLATKLSWFDARDACANSLPPSHLVTITSDPEQTFVQTIASSIAVKPSDRWIGLRAPTPTTSKAAFTWIAPDDPSSYDHWLPGEPNGDGECVRLEQDYHWGDFACATKFASICERE
ncbi:MAG: hypothetical protein NVS3B20_11050 [Polyangiales bacterium]